MPKDVHIVGTAPKGVVVAGLGRSALASYCMMTV
jgi:hypothetical protein